MGWINSNQQPIHPYLTSKRSRGILSPPARAAARVGNQCNHCQQAWSVHLPRLSLYRSFSVSRRGCISQEIPKTPDRERIPQSYHNHTSHMQSRVMASVRNDGIMMVSSMKEGGGEPSFQHPTPIISGVRERNGTGQSSHAIKK